MLAYTAKVRPACGLLGSAGMRRDATLSLLAILVGSCAPTAEPASPTRLDLRRGGCDPELPTGSEDPPTFVWCAHAGGPRYQIARRVAAWGPKLFATGYYLVTADFGAGPLPAPGDQEILWASFDTDAAKVVAEGFGGVGRDRGEDIAVDDLGNTYVTGLFTGTVDLGSGPVTASGTGEPDLFVSSYDPDGRGRWSLGFGDAASDWGTSVVVTSGGDVVVAARFWGSIDVGGGAFVADREDILIATFDSAGNHIRSVSYGGEGSEFPSEIASDHGGGIVVAGAYGAPFSAGGAVLPHDDSEEIFVAAYDATGGHRWSASVTGKGRDRATGVAVDGCGDVLVVGFFEETLAFAGGVLDSAGHRDAFVLRYDSSGAHVWAARIGGRGRDEARAVAVDLQGNVYVGGFFSGEVTFAPGDKRFSNGDVDGFVVSYDRWGSYRWVRTFGGSQGLGYDDVRDVSVRPDGDVVIYGTVNGTADIGCGVVAAEDTDVFLSVLRRP